ncbi:MAG: glycosyltransferase [Campylobacterales bacterium]|nr:glycosyltransferase [Campylobacterales bacterium]
MKLSLIIPSFYPAVIYGGPIFSTLHTCQELAKLEEVEVYVSTTNANMTTKLDVKTATWIKFQERFHVKYYNTTFTHILSIPMFVYTFFDIKKTDIVHIQSVFNVSTFFALLYCKNLNKPALLSPRGQFGGWCLENGNTFKHKWLKWFIKPFANKVVWHVTAQQEKDEILSLFPHAKVAIIPNGIEYDTFQNSNILSKKEYVKKFTKQEIEPNKVIVSMGRLQKKKGFDILIDSFFEILKSFPDSILLIAGGDEGEERNLKDQIARLYLEDRVFLVGAIGGQEKIDFLANADLFVLPSHNENFGNVYVESLAAGTPIVASKNTPWEEVEDADCGRWVNNTMDETAQAMVEMLGKDREQMRMNAKKLAKKYDWKNIALQFKEVFENMVRK